MSNPNPVTGLPGIVADNSAAGLTAQLGRVWDSLLDLGATLTDDQWVRATPCPGWTIAGQFAHMIGTESTLLGRPNPEVDPGSPEHVKNKIGGFNEVWVVHLASRPRPEVLDLFREITTERRQALGDMTDDDFSAPSWTPVGEADYRRFMQIRVFDCWVHEQDIRDGLGRPGHESGPVAEQSVDEMVRALGYIIGKKAGAPSGSSVRIGLTGGVQRTLDVAVADGRARVVDDLAGDPTATVALGSTAFARLACGRVSPTAVLDEGQLGGARLAGDRDLGRRVVENLAFTI